MSFDTKISMGNFNFFNKTYNIDLILCCWYDGWLFFITWKKSCHNIIKREFNFMKILMSGNRCIFLEKKLLSIFYLLNASVNTAEDSPKKQIKQRYSSTYHAKNKIKFFVIPVRISVVSIYIIISVKSISNYSSSRRISTECFTLPKHINISTIVPPWQYWVINKILFLRTLYFKICW